MPRFDRTSRCPETTALPGSEAVRSVFVLMVSGFVAACGQAQLAEDNTATHMQSIAEALVYLGSDISANQLSKNERGSDGQLESVLDQHLFLNLDDKGQSTATAELAQEGWVNLLLKTSNRNAIGCEIAVASESSLPVVNRSAGQRFPLPENRLSDQDLEARFLELHFYENSSVGRQVSNAQPSYFILQAYTRVTHARTAELEFSFNNCESPPPRRSVTAEFSVRPAVKVALSIRDPDGSPQTAALTITDNINRLVPEPKVDPLPSDYRNRFALRPPWERLWTATTAVDSPAPGARTTGIYPLPSRRIATRDTFPDLYFQAQIYREDGEYVLLQPGSYSFEVRRGPETKVQSRKVVVGAGSAEQSEAFVLERWIDLVDKHWFSSDLHVHASGCKHHEAPDNGLLPNQIWRQARGEDLSVVSVLNWGVGWYDNQKYFREQKQKKFGDPTNLLHYDIEVSEMPSGHLGHIALLGLTSDEYPGADSIDDWPSWTIPILRWAKDQNAITGFLHTGWGMQPTNPTAELPNLVMPAMNGIGANEFVVAVTQDLVDLYAAGDTSPLQELNTWYHALNSGYRPRLMGESDFPCVYHEKIGIARGYAKIDGELSFDNYLQQMQAGRSYVSDGFSHIIEFEANGAQLGVQDSEVLIAHGQSVSFSANVAAYLSAGQTPLESFIAAGGDQRQPSWTIEKARIGATREVLVELVVNGSPVAARKLVANGEWQHVEFDYTPSMSSWAALRIYPSSHTNPLFILVDGKKIRASQQSAEWLQQTAQRLWSLKSGDIRDSERDAARETYLDAHSRLEEIGTEAAHQH